MPKPTEIGLSARFQEFGRIFKGIFRSLDNPPPQTFPKRQKLYADSQNAPHVAGVNAQLDEGNIPLSEGLYQAFSDQLQEHKLRGISIYPRPLDMEGTARSLYHESRIIAAAEAEGVELKKTVEDLANAGLLDSDKEAQFRKERASNASGAYAHRLFHAVKNSNSLLTISCGYDGAENTGLDAMNSRLGIE